MSADGGQDHYEREELGAPTPFFGAQVDDHTSNASGWDQVSMIGRPKSIRYKELGATKEGRMPSKAPMSGAEERSTEASTPSTG